MCRVAIIGNAGGGKSTLGRQLARAKRLPLHAVDRFQWKPGWQPVPESETCERLNSLLTQERWIVDGWGPWDCIIRRFQESDTIVFVDFPVWIHLWWAARRQIRAFLRPSTIDTPAGCDLRVVTLRMFQMILHIDRNITPKLRALVASQKPEKDVFHITSPRGLREFMAEYC